MRWSRAAVLLLFGLLAACAEPPSKEMNQAQGAIDGAKAAGAEQYAPSELTAAVDSLRKSEEAVTQRDYRLALSHAIDSRERAQNAAKTAVNARARARGDAEAQLAEASTLLAQGRERLRDPTVARLPRKTVQDTRAILEAAQKSLQEARAAVNADDYPRAIHAIEGVAARLQAALNDLQQAIDTSTGSRRR